ncbi:MAG: hypothetical protein CM1200mP22_06950 [Dehalococcoidia bacterium]|nr:MAG: hypothetical protein CM1200mP22_06950 [Dehalococcoidia bacterium]
MAFLFYEDRHYHLDVPMILKWLLNNHRILRQSGDRTCQIRITVMDTNANVEIGEPGNT